MLRRSAVLRRLTAGALLLSALACGDDGAAATADPPPVTKAAPATTQASGAERNSAPGGGSVVLSGADIFKVAPGLIEEGVAVSGGLRPIETLSIRARVEGDVLEVPVREGDAVAVGALLARFESSEQEAALKSAEADRLAAESDAATARWNLDQTRDLFTAGAVPEREMRAATQASAAAAARLAAADARLRSAALAARDTRVVAPVAGTIERRAIERGVRAARGAELFTLVRTDVLELTAAVPARRIGGVRTGQVVRFFADGREIEGRVARISPTIDPASQSVTVYVQVPNADGALKGNTFATGQIIERALPNSLLVPQSAIRQPAATAGNTLFVWRLVGGALERAPVELGIVDEARGVVQVLSGLAAGDEVVIGNVGMLGAGMRVQLIGTEAARPRP
jgi:RND family efflux transporter MFP subunit